MPTERPARTSNMRHRRQDGVRYAKNVTISTYVAKNGLHPRSTLTLPLRPRGQVGCGRRGRGGGDGLRSGEGFRLRLRAPLGGLVNHTPGGAGGLVAQLGRERNGLGFGRGSLFRELSCERKLAKSDDASFVGPMGLNNG